MPKLSSEQLAEIEALREEDYSDEEIAELLGMTVATLRELLNPVAPARAPARQRRPPKAPEPPAPRQKESFWLSPRSPTPEGRRLLATLREFDESERDLVDRFAHTRRGSRPAKNLRLIELTRVGKMQRVAEAMARQRGMLWWQMTERQRQFFADLAELAVTAIEIVEDEQEIIANGRHVTVERLERALGREHGF